MRSLAIALAFTSYSALAACPKLEGTYAACRSTTGSMSESTEMVVTQKTKNGITTYTVTSTDSESQERKSEDMIADGKTRTETQNDPELGEITASMTFTCSGPKVVGDMSVIAQGTPLIELHQEVSKNGSALEMDYAGTIFGMEFTDTLICE